MRQAYDGIAEPRGRPDLTTTWFSLTAPVSFAGEVMPTEAALLERIIPVNYDPKYIKPKDRHRAYQEIRRLPLEGLIARYIPFCLQIDLDKYWKSAVAKTKGSVHTDIPSRIVDNLCVVTLGLLLFMNYTNGWGIPVTDFVKANVENTMKDILNILLSGRGEPKLACDQLLEQLSIMAMSMVGKNYRLNKNVNYTLNKNGELCLHMPSCLAEFRKFARETQYVGEVLDDNTYRRQFKSRPYFRGIRAVKFEDKTRWAVIVDLNECERHQLDVSGFKS
jgi:hypothetical protein